MWRTELKNENMRNWNWQNHPSILMHLAHYCIQWLTVDSHGFRYGTLPALYLEMLEIDPTTFCMHYLGIYSFSLQSFPCPIPATIAMKNQALLALRSMLYVFSSKLFYWLVNSVFRCVAQWNENFVSKLLPLAFCLHLSLLPSMTDTWATDGANGPEYYC